MKTWTYLEMKTKILNDCDLQDESFITPDELIGYFNEAISEAEAEIQGTREDYFLSKYYLPCVLNQDTYSMPDDIYINKIRGFVYVNGTTVYDIKRLKVWHKFNTIEMVTSFGSNDDYQYYITNTSPGNTKLVILPKARETAILPQVSPNSAFTPMKLWYIRAANRIPIHSEFVLDYESYILPAAVSTGADTITLVNTGYVTGDQVKLSAFGIPGGTAGLPAPLVAGTIYYVIATGTAGVIKLATTAANASAGTAIDLTTTGSSTGYFNVAIAAQDAVINATLVDIPEFSTFVMQWVKCRCFEKEGDPRLDGAVGTLEQQRKQMVDTLTEMVIDADTEIEADFSHYQEMS